MANPSSNKSSEEEINSLAGENLSDSANFSNHQTSPPTSSSSLGLSTDDEGTAGQIKEVRRKSSGVTNRPNREELMRMVEGVAFEANQEKHEIERRRKGKSVETPEGTEAQRRVPHQVTGIHDLTETDDEEEVAPHGWKNLMEEAVDKLIEVSAAQHELMEGHKRQMTKVVNLIDRMISWMKREHKPSHPTSQGPNMKRSEPTTATNQPSSTRHGSSAAKRARHSGSQRRN